jgi:hypothetical protein
MYKGISISSLTVDRDSRTARLYSQEVYQLSMNNEAYCIPGKAKNVRELTSNFEESRSIKFIDWFSSVAKRHDIKKTLVNKLDYQAPRIYKHIDNC